MNISIIPASHAPARKSRATLAKVAAGAGTGFGWLMCTLATGAVAAFAALVLGVRPSWLLLLLALPLTVALKFCGCLYGRWSAPVAAASVLLAGFYAACLVAIARIAAATGFPFGLAFRTGGIALTLQVAKLGLNALSVLVYAGAAALAAALAARLASSGDRP
ncbi:MAG: hypothetical protein EPN38_00715 [Rhodanobacteraceae bacterium]|nr:MAG: hypothetical protein EPN38_00715 [Rhodanobacteraceae bacterium]